jgi:magnesium transporter
MKHKNNSILAKDIAKQVDTVVDCNKTIKEALEDLRKKTITHKIIYFYVVDGDKKLIGVVSTRNLLLSSPETKISDIMNTSVISLSPDQTLHGAMELFTRYGLLALPVTDNERHLLGIVDVEMYVEESCDVADARHRQDVFQIIGLTLEDENKPSVWKGYRLRMPWILCNLLGGIFCAIISRINEDVLSKVLLFAMFIPLVLTLSESISMQAMTHSLQFVRSPKTTFKQVFFKAFNEWKIISIMAITSAVIVTFVSLFWGDGILASTTIGTGILISVVISASFGITLPIVLHISKLDPKVASGPVVLMLADVITTAIYLGLASWWFI